MNKKNIQLVCIVMVLMSIFFSEITYGDNLSEETESLFLVSGSPMKEGFYPFEIKFPVVLYSLTNQQDLKRERVITTWRQSAIFVRPYYDEGLLLVGSESQPGYFQIDVVDFQNAQNEKSFEVEFCQDCNNIKEYFFVKNKQKNVMFQTGRMVGKQSFEQHLTGFNLTKNEKIELNWSDIQYVRSYGSSGGNIDGGDWLDGIYVLENKPIYSAQQKIPLNWSLPNNVTFTNNDRLFQSVNTDSLRVFGVVKPRKTNDSKQSKLTYFVQDKVNKIWHSETIKGDRLRVRAFGDWIVAEETYSKFKDNEKYNQLIQDNLKASSNRVFGKTRFEAYPPYLMRTKSLNINQTGVMHLTNVKKNIRLQIKTSDPDSEVLLVKDGKVIYRVGDEIMQADISGNSIKNTKLLIKDNIVPSIHWVFYGK